MTNETNATTGVSGATGVSGTTGVSAGHVVDELIERGRELYTLPKVAIDVLDLTAQPQTDAAALKECIEFDPALTARIMRVVNSSLFGLNSQITDLTHAIGLLGIKPLKLLVLGFSLPPALFEGLDEESLETYWKTSLIRAAACREIARETQAADAEEAFIAGLLEGLGILLLIQQLRDAYTRFYLQVNEQGLDLASVEREHLDFDHRLLTAQLLRRWHFPDSLIQAVARTSHGQHTSATTVLANILGLADHLTRLLAFPGNSEVRGLIDKAESDFGMSIDECRQLVDRLEGSVPPLAEIFAVNWDNGQYMECLGAAHRAMSELAEDPATSVSPSSSPATPSSHAGDLSESGESVRTAIDVWLTGDPTAKPAPPRSGGRSSVAGNRPAAAPSATTPMPKTLDPGLIGRLQKAIVIARQRQRSVGLCLFEYHHIDQIELSVGGDGLAVLELLMRRLVESELEPSMPTCVARDGQIAAICIGHDRSRIARSARRVLEQLGSQVEQELNAVLPTLPAAGAAILEIPPRNFTAATLVEAAERCLYAAHTAGGQTVKTIEL